MLTNLIGQDLDALTESIALYRSEWNQAGHARPKGLVTLMLHTLVGPKAAATAREPLREYMRAWVNLERSARGGHQAISASLQEELLDCAVARYLDAALVGPEDRCLDTLAELHQRGVDEIACLVDFGPEEADVLAGLARLVGLVERAETRFGIR